MVFNQWMFSATVWATLTVSAFVFSFWRIEWKRLVLVNWFAAIYCLHCFIFCLDVWDICFVDALGRDLIVTFFAVTWFEILRSGVWGPASHVLPRELLGLSCLCIWVVRVNRLKFDDPVFEFLDRRPRNTPVQSHQVHILYWRRLFLICKYVWVGREEPRFSLGLASHDSC